MAAHVKGSHNASESRLLIERLFNLETAVGGDFFLTQRRREAENAEKIANLQFYRSDPNNLLLHPLGDVLLIVWQSLG